MTETQLSFIETDVRLINRQRSPKKGGSSELDSLPYLKELNVEIIGNEQPIQFTPNIDEHIHRWSPYVQGFSASFVQSQLNKYKNSYKNPVIYDPFAGCGTVLVQSKLNNLPSYGTELNPLLQFIAHTKLNTWDVSPSYLVKIFESLPKDLSSPAPSFLKSEAHFNDGVLKNLEFIKGGIDSFQAKTLKQQKAIDLIKVAFSSILIDSSNLKRSPCLGYDKKKIVEDATPLVLMRKKINDIAEDLTIIRETFKDNIPVTSDVYLANSTTYEHKNNYDLVITSPPYMNGMDYVINYKIEMGWLDFAEEQKELKTIKDDMVVCDNVSKGLIREFSLSDNTYTNDWIEEIKERIQQNIIKRGAYRRKDMPYIVHKYFDDMYHIMKNVISAIKPDGRFILVVGDSLIADTYLPTDLLIAKIGEELGMKIETIEKARERRSGQIRSYKLRETIITLRK